MPPQLSLAMHHFPFPHHDILDELSGVQAMLEHGLAQ